MTTPRASSARPASRRYNPDSAYCLNDPSDPLNGGGTGKGVYFQDITPRWGVAWDVFGNGKTAIKYSQGKYLDGLQVGGIYTAANPARRRTVNNLHRAWTDANGDRRVDCDLRSLEALPRLPSASRPTANAPPRHRRHRSIGTSRRFGRSPAQLDEARPGHRTETIYCGQDERSMRQAEIRTYCKTTSRGRREPAERGGTSAATSGSSSLACSTRCCHASAEVTYNRRVIGNQTVTMDRCGLRSVRVHEHSGRSGAVHDRSPEWPEQLLRLLLHPGSGDPRLPGGGGYGLNIATPKQISGTTSANVSYVQAPGGLGVNALARAEGVARTSGGAWIRTSCCARGGLRISGGTSTGKRTDNTCRAHGRPATPPKGPISVSEGYVTARTTTFQTNVRGTASYTIPWIDVLFSSTFSYRPGVQVGPTTSSA